MTAVIRPKGAPPGLRQPDYKIGSFIDPATGLLHICAVDVQRDHAFQVWHQALGWLPPVPYDRPTFSVASGFNLFIHDSRYKVVAFNYVDGQVCVVDLGPIPS